jgi:hypothetical protein
MKENICNEFPLMSVVSSVKLNVPVEPYNNEMPNNNKPEENAEDMIILKAASEDRRLSRSKLHKAANGIVDNSRPK